MGVLQGRTALITGAGQGIGQAIAEAMAQAGAAVVVTDIDEAQARWVAEGICAGGGAAIGLRLDTTREEEHLAAIAAAQARFGALHIACNSAGIAGAGHAVRDYDLADWQRLFAVNVQGVFLGLKTQAKAMQPHGGAIVNVGSTLGVVPQLNASAYVAAKHAVHGLTRAAAMDCAADGIRVNAVAPGYVDTPMLHRYPAERIATLKARHLLGRLARAEEVAAAVVWLCSDAASFVTGTILPVDGGYLSGGAVQAAG